MKTRIISVLLIISLVLSLFCVTSFADSSDTTLEQEISTNLPEIDVSKLAQDKVTVLGAVEDITDEFSLYLYVYNPEQLVLMNGWLNLTVTGTSSSGDIRNKSYDKIAYSIVNSSNKYLKLRVNLSSISEYLDGYHASHTYSWNKVYFNFLIKGGCYSYQDSKYTFTWEGEKCYIERDVSEVVTLEVNHTYYRTGNTSEKRVVDEIHSVYFSIPEEFTTYYSKLYSVSSSYYKKHTTPIILGTKEYSVPSLSGPGYAASIFDPVTAPLYYINQGSFISSDAKIDTSTAMNIYIANFGYNLSASVGLLSYTYHVENMYEDPFFYYFYVDENSIKDIEDLKIDNQALLDYISYVQAKGYNLNLFDSTEFYPSSTKTVNDTFDSISYGSQASFNTVAKDYGAYYAFLLWLYRDNDAKKQELLDKWGFEVNYKDITDEPYLILVDDAMKAELNKMTDQEISDTYLINLSDVDDFRYYVRSNKNVVLYRFDVTDYYSELLDFSSTPVKGIFNPDPEQYAVVQQSIYYNFKVIDLTFELEDGYHSYVVNSDPKDFTSDPGYVDTDKPPVDFDSGEIKDNLEDGWDKFVNKLEEFKKKFEDLQKTFDKVVRIVLISTAVVIAAVGVKFAYSGIVKVSKNKKQNERKNSSKKE